MSVASSDKCVVRVERWLLAPVVIVLYHMTCACTVTVTLEHRKGRDSQNRTILGELGVQQALAIVWLELSCFARVRVWRKSLFRLRYCRSHEGFEQKCPL